MEAILAEYQLKLDERKAAEQSKKNPDWFLNMRTSYQVNTWYSCEVVVRHKYERTDKQCYELKFITNDGKYAGCVSREYLPNTVTLQSIKDCLDKAQITWTSKDLNKLKKVTIDFLSLNSSSDSNYVNDIDSVIGIGTFCMSSRPCKHMLVVETDDGQEVTIKYAAADQIKAIYDATGQTQRPHILESLAELEREDAEFEREEQAEKDGVPQVYSLYTYDNTLVMMNGDPCIFEKDLFKYVLHRMRDCTDFCEDWEEYGSRYDSYEPELKREIACYVSEVQDETKVWLDDLTHGVYVTCTRVPLVPEFDSAEVCKNIEPRQGIAATMDDPPRQWYLDLVAEIEAENSTDIEISDEQLAALI